MYIKLKRNINIKYMYKDSKIIKSEDRRDHRKQNETKDKHRTHNITLKT